MTGATDLALVPAPYRFLLPGKDEIQFSIQLQPGSIDTRLFLSSGCYKEGHVVLLQFPKTSVPD
jgi:hypothetical protein